MYIHIGGEYSIPEKMIVGVFGFDEITDVNNDNVKMLKKAETENRLENVSFDLPRSIIVTVERIYLSPISPRTIRKRIDVWNPSDQDDPVDVDEDVRSLSDRGSEEESTC